MTTKKEKLLKEALGDHFEEYIAFQKMEWVGPFTVNDLLNNCFNEFYKPPKSASVYVVSNHQWKQSPSLDSIPLYVGGNTGKSRQFRRRVGDLIADIFGFWGHSSGGQSLYRYCEDNKLNPKNLYVGWLKYCGCDRCTENYLYDDLKPKLNKIKPPACKKHFGKNRYLAIIP